MTSNGITQSYGPTPKLVLSRWDIVLSGKDSTTYLIDDQVQWKGAPLDVGCSATKRPLTPSIFCNCP
jgi:hypothetical protein